MSSAQPITMAHDPVTALYLLFGIAAALCLYSASPHQTFWVRAQRYGQLLRLAGIGAAALSMLSASHVLGTWSGIFASLTTIMLASVVLPYLDAYVRLHRVG